jgi:hypothetical protein
MITLDILAPVAVESNKVRPLNSTLALCANLRVSTEGRAKWLFLCLYASVPLTILSAYVFGSEGVKRISLTQGERLHEGSAPSDKRVIGLMTTTCRRNSDPINKAAEQHKENPCWTPSGELDLVPSPTLVIIV